MIYRIVSFESKMETDAVKGDGMKNLPRVFFVVACCVAILSCGDLFSEKKIEVQFDYDAFSVQQRLWRDSGPADYQYNLYTSGRFAADTVISVKNGKFDSQTKKPGGEYEESDRYLTITEIYDDILDLYLKYNDTEQTEDDCYLKSITVEYDEENHIPVTVQYIFYVPSGMYAERNNKYEIKDFKKLGGDTGGEDNGDEDTEPTVEFDYAGFLREKNLWEISGIKDYRYRFFYPMLPGPAEEAVVVVRNNETVAMYSAPNREGADTHRRTIDAVYDHIDAVYRNPGSVTKITVSYDANHIPVKTRYEYTYAPDPDTMGDYFSVEEDLITDFRKITVNPAVEFDYETFIKESTLWLLSDTLYYKFNYYSDGFYPVDTIITVQNNEFESQILNPAAQPNFFEYSGPPPTISTLYEDMEYAYTKNAGKEPSADDRYLTGVSVEFDKINHIPVEVKYTYHVPPNLAVDGNSEYEIRDFTILP
jgi:hypothetical protein